MTDVKRASKFRPESVSLDNAPRALSKTVDSTIGLDVCQHHSSDVFHFFGPPCYTRRLLSLQTWLFVQPRVFVLQVLLQQDGHPRHCISCSRGRGRCDGHNHVPHLARYRGGRERVCASRHAPCATSIAQDRYQRVADLDTGERLKKTYGRGFPLQKSDWIISHTFGTMSDDTWLLRKKVSGVILNGITLNTSHISVASETSIKCANTW